MSVSMSAERVPDRQLVGTPAPQPGEGSLPKCRERKQSFTDDEQLNPPVAKAP